MYPRGDYWLQDRVVRENWLSQVAGWGNCFWNSGFNTREKMFSPNPKQFMLFALLGYFLVLQGWSCYIQGPYFCCLCNIGYQDIKEQTRLCPINHFLLYFRENTSPSCWLSPANWDLFHFGHIFFPNLGFSIEKKGTIANFILSSKDNNRATTCKGEKQVNS